MVVQEVLQRRLEPWRWGVQWLAIGSWQRPTKRIIKVDSLTTTGEVAQEFSIDLSMMVWYLKQIAKVKKLSKWVYCEQTANQKSHPFGESSSLILHNNNDFSIGLWHEMKTGFYTTTSNDQLSGWTEKKLQSTSQSQTCAQKRSWSLFSGLRPIWPTTAFWIPEKPLHLRCMLSELMRCTKNCKA